MKKHAADKVVNLPGSQDQLLVLRRMHLGVMDVLTPLIGFENGAYALHCAGFEYIGDIATARRSDIATVRGISENKLKRIASFLRKLELTFETESTAWLKWRAEVIGEDEPEPVAAQVSRPVLRRWSFMQAEFEEVRPSQVDARTLMTVRDWMRGVELIWLKLPSLKAAMAAEKLWSSLAAVRELEDEILQAYAAGAEPDPRLLRRCEVLKIGLEAYGLFIGFQHGIEVEREPSAAAIAAAKGVRLPLVIDHD